MQMDQKLLTNTNCPELILVLAQGRAEAIGTPVLLVLLASTAVSSVGRPLTRSVGKVSQSEFVVS